MRGLLAASIWRVGPSPIRKLQRGFPRCGDGPTAKPLWDLIADLCKCVWEPAQPPSGPIVIPEGSLCGSRIRPHVGKPPKELMGCGAGRQLHILRIWLRFAGAERKGPWSRLPACLAGRDCRVSPPCIPYHHSRPYQNHYKELLETEQVKG